MPRPFVVWLIMSGTPKVISQKHLTHSIEKPRKNVILLHNTIIENNILNWFDQENLVF